MEKIVHIYALSDPRDNRVRYIGRTVTSLQRRLCAHISTALRGKLRDTRKADWIKALHALHLSPVITSLETTTYALFKHIEKEYVRTFRASHPDLLNITRGGDGGLGVSTVEWTPELNTMLGNLTDSAIAKKIGVTRKTVSYQREKLGISASFDRSLNVPPPKMGGHNCKVITPEIKSKLGLMTDAKLGLIAGVSKKRIMNERHALGIASYAAITGNTGRYGVKVNARKIELTDSRLSILGTMPDNRAADILGLSHSRTAVIRNLLNIPSFRSARNVNIQP